MILWLIDEVPCPPKSRLAVIPVCGSSWLVPVLDVLHLRLTACHFFYLACLCVCGNTVTYQSGLMGRQQFAWEFAFAK